MANIQEYLDLIKNAIYGKDVRQAIHDGIQQCYYDGHAGSTDLEARQQLDAERIEIDSIRTSTEYLKTRVDTAETDIDTLDARIDQIVTPSGSAPSAAEVADGRVVDGVTYDLIGDAIRSVNDNSKSGIMNKNNSVKNIVALDAEMYTGEMLTNKVLNASGEVSTVSGDAYKVTDYIPVEAGMVIACKYSRARWANQNWAFFDGDKNVLTTYGKAASATSVEYCEKIVVPYGAKYFVLARDENGISNEPPSDVAIIHKYAESVDTAPKSVDYSYADGSMSETLLTGTDMSSKLVTSSGLVNNTTSAEYRVSEFTVLDTDIVNIRNCQTRYSNKMYAFYDASGLPINVKEREDNNVHDFLMLEVPFGAVKLAVSGYQSYATVSKVTKLIVASSSWGNKKWACMGDSITDANNSRATKRYFDYIEDVTGITVVNLGKSGTGYKKDYNDNLPFYQRVDTIPLDSDVITIFGSGNDCSLTLGNVTDTGTDTVCGCINNTIDGIRARIVGANIGIISPTPWQQYPTYTENNMSRYCDALEQICKLKGVPFLNLYRCSNMLPWEQSFRQAFYTRDDGNGTHPDENGHKFFAPHIKAFLETLLM